MCPVWTEILFADVLLSNCSLSYLLFNICVVVIMCSRFYSLDGTVVVTSEQEMLGIGLNKANILALTLNPKVLVWTPGTQVTLWPC